MTEYLLGLDSGGTMTKAALYTLSGEEVANAARATEMLFTGPGFTERDPMAMWSATCDAIRSVLSDAKIDSAAVLVVCATGYGSGLFCVNDKGLPTRNGIVSTDTRAIDIVNDWSEQGLVGEIEQTVLQAVWPAQSLTLMKWVQDNEPDTMRKTSQLLLCKDFNKLRLTGEFNTDFTDAAVAGVYDLNGHQYATSLLEKCGLGGWVEKLPRLLDSTEIAGTVTAEAAQSTGLSKGTPVIAGAIDIVVSALASGLTRDDQLSVVAGTWSINNAARLKPQTAPLPSLQMPYPVDNMYIACAASATSASNLEWMCKKVLDGDAEIAKRAGKSIYDICSEMVASRRDSPSQIAFFPYLYGGPDNARASFIGMTASDEKADLVHAVFEGIVFAHKAHVDELAKAAVAQQPKVVRLAGGASKSTVWAQMFADVLNLPVEITKGSELGALGSCVLGSVGTGRHGSVNEAVEKMVSVESRFEPDATRHARYMDRYERFSQLSRALSDCWQ